MPVGGLFDGQRLALAAVDPEGVNAAPQAAHVHLGRGHAAGKNAAQRQPALQKDFFLRPNLCSPQKTA